MNHYGTKYILTTDDMLKMVVLDVIMLVATCNLFGLIYFQAFTQTRITKSHLYEVLEYIHILCSLHNSCPFGHLMHTSWVLMLGMAGTNIRNRKWS
jgi:hypothetical protein